MRHIIEQSDEYAALAAEVIEAHEDLHWIREQASIGYLSSDQEKKKSGMEVLGECILVKELYRVFCPYDFLIVIYEANTAGMSQEQLKILLYHELLHVGMKESEEEPEYVVNPHDVEDFRIVLESYGLDWARKGGE